MEDVLSLIELANYLKISKSALYKLSERGGIPSFKAGKVLRFRKPTIDKWIEHQEKKSIKRRR